MRNIGRAGAIAGLTVVAALGATQAASAAEEADTAKAPGRIVERGTVLSVHETRNGVAFEVGVRGESGPEITWVATAGTKVFEDGERTSASEIDPGDEVEVQAGLRPANDKEIRLVADVVKLS